MNYYTDPASGRQYYVDPATGQTRWLDQAQHANDLSVFSQRTEVRPARKEASTWRMIAACGVSLVVGIGIGSIDGADSATSTVTSAELPAASPTAAKPAPKAKAPAVIVIKDPRTFGDAFDANQIAAERQWNGKRVQLTAEIQNITDGQVSFTGVTTEEFSFTQVVCELSDPEQALSLKNGSKATAIGTVDGQSMGVISLKDCVIK